MAISGTTITKEVLSVNDNNWLYYEFITDVNFTVEPELDIVSTNLVIDPLDEGEDGNPIAQRRSVEIELVTKNKSEILNWVNDALKLVLIVNDYYFYGLFREDGIEFSETDYATKIKLVFVDGISALKNTPFPINSNSPTLKNPTTADYTAFRYLVWKHIFTELHNQGYDKVRVYGSPMKYDKNGNRASTKIEKTNSTNHSTWKGLLDTAQVDIEAIAGKTIYDVLKMLCKALGYVIYEDTFPVDSFYTGFYTRELVFMHREYRHNDEYAYFAHYVYDASVGYMRAEYVYDDMPYDNSPINLNSLPLSTVKVNTMGGRNVRVKADYGLNTSKFKAFDILAKTENTTFQSQALNINIDNPIIRKGSYPMSGDALFFQNGKLLRYYCDSNYASINWMTRYIGLPIYFGDKIGDYPTNYITVDLAVKFKIDKYDEERYYSTILLTQDNFNESGTSNTFIAPSAEPRYVAPETRSGDVFSYKKRTIAVNKDEETLYYRLYGVNNARRYTILIAPACYQFAQPPFESYQYVPMTISVECQLRLFNGNFPSGETVNIINNSAFKAIEEELELAAMPRVGDGAYLWDRPGVYNNYVTHDISGETYLVGSNDSEKYPITEYIGRIIAQQLNGVSRTIDIEVGGYTLSSYHQRPNYMAQHTYNESSYLLSSAKVDLIGEFASLKLREYKGTTYILIDETGAYTLDDENTTTRELVTE